MPKPQRMGAGNLFGRQLQSGRHGGHRLAAWCAGGPKAIPRIRRPVEFCAAGVANHSIMDDEAGCRRAVNGYVEGKSASGYSSRRG